MNSFKGNPADDMFNMFSKGGNVAPSDEDKASFFKEFDVDFKKSTSDVSKAKGPKKVNSSSEY